MKNIITLFLIIAFPLAGPALAADLPSHYPDEGFNRTGKVDAVHTIEGRVVINDLPYQVSKSAIVHSLTAERVSIARIRKGVHVAFRTNGNRVIEEFWLLPSNYSLVKRR